MNQISLTIDWKSENFERVVQLYDGVGWKVYSQHPEQLRRALVNSTYVLVAKSGEELVGLLRSMTDDVSIHYIQDILVTPPFQRQGVGKQLVEAALKRFAHVRTHLLLTDDEEKQHRFYQLLELENLKDFRGGKLNSFIKMA